MEEDKDLNDELLKIIEPILKKYEVKHFIATIFTKDSRVSGFTQASVSVDTPNENLYKVDIILLESHIKRLKSLLNEE